jgi:hypothetical protein
VYLLLIRRSSLQAPSLAHNPLNRHMQFGLICKTKCQVRYAKAGMNHRHS